jgi:hypothetical protein
MSCPRKSNARVTYMTGDVSRGKRPSHLLPSGQKQAISPVLSSSRRPSHDLVL